MVKKDERKERKGESRQTRAVIDRMEDGDMAVLMVGKDEEMDVPAALLPDGAANGDHLIITISLDQTSRSAAEERIRKLQAELKGQSAAEDKKDFKL